MYEELAPIVLFVYNRPWHTYQTVESLKKNELAAESELFIFSDGAKTNDARLGVDNVRNYIDNLDGFKKLTVIKRDENWGLANSIIDGVTKIVNQYGKVIVLEDDLLTSPHFLNYMNKSLNLYQKADNVASIHGYIYPIDGLPNTFFIKGADCWGWATWKKSWDMFDPNGQRLLDKVFDKGLEVEVDMNGSYGFTKMLKRQINGQNDSWAVRWYVSAFLNNMLTLYPGQSLVSNIGFDTEGTHCRTSKIFDVELNQGFKFSGIEVRENVQARKKIELFLKKTNLSLLKKIIFKLDQIINR